MAHIEPVGVQVGPLPQMPPLQTSPGQQPAAPHIWPAFEHVVPPWQVPFRHCVEQHSALLVHIEPVGEQVGPLPQMPALQVSPGQQPAAPHV